MAIILTSLYSKCSNISAPPAILYRTSMAANSQSALKAGDWKCVFKGIWAKKKDIGNITPGVTSQNAL